MKKSLLFWSIFPLVAVVFWACKLRVEESRTLAQNESIDLSMLKNYKMSDLALKFDPKTKTLSLKKEAYGDYALNSVAPGSLEDFVELAKVSRLLNPVCSGYFFPAKAGNMDRHRSAFVLIGYKLQCKSGE